MESCWPTGTDCWVVGTDCSHQRRPSAVVRNSDSADRIRTVGNAPMRRRPTGATSGRCYTHTSMQSQYTHTRQQQMPNRKPMTYCAVCRLFKAPNAPLGRADSNRARFCRRNCRCRTKTACASASAFTRVMFIMCRRIHGWTTSAALADFPSAFVQRRVRTGLHG